MPNPFPHLHQKLRALVCAIVAVFLVITSLVIIFTQFTEVSAKNENLSLASFLVILTFSGVAFQWAGVTASFIEIAVEHSLLKQWKTSPSKFFLGAG